MSHFLEDPNTEGLPEPAELAPVDQLQAYSDFWWQLTSQVLKDNFDGSFSVRMPGYRIAVRKVEIDPPLPQTTRTSNTSSSERRRAPSYISETPSPFYKEITITTYESESIPFEQTVVFMQDKGVITLVRQRPRILPASEMNGEPPSLMQKTAECIEATLNQVESFRQEAEQVAAQMAIKVRDILFTNEPPRQNTVPSTLIDNRYSEINIITEPAILIDVWPQPAAGSTTRFVIKWKCSDNRTSTQTRGKILSPETACLILEDNPSSIRAQIIAGMIADSLRNQLSSTSYKIALGSKRS